MTQWPDRAKQQELYTNVFADANIDRYYFIMVVLSCTVATYGLLSNSTAVVIGAMLIAPLMGPILGGALAVATNSNRLLFMSAKAEAFGALTAVILAAVLTLLLPRTELTAEVLARTTPTLLDLVVALASGAAGTYALCVKPQSATLPGVAIATALMPPLCVVGIGLAKQDFSVVSGAFLLFLANMIAINVAAIAMFEFAGFSGDSLQDNAVPLEKRKTLYRMRYPVLLLIIISIPLVGIMYKTYGNARTEKIINASLTESLAAIAPHSTLISVKYQDEKTRYTIDAAFRTTKIITPENIRQMENLLELRLGRPVSVSSDVVLVQKVNDKTNVDTFKELLPKVTEKQIVEVVKSSTPEEIIERALTEKLTLFPGAVLNDYGFEYHSGAGTYTIHAKISTTAVLNDSFKQALQSILEEQLKRRVLLNVEVSLPVPSAVNSDAPSMPPNSPAVK